MSHSINIEIGLTRYDKNSTDGKKLAPTYKLSNPPIVGTKLNVDLIDLVRTITSEVVNSISTIAVCPKASTHFSCV